MNGGMSRMAKQELLATIRDRYRRSSKKGKGRILDEFIAVTGHHRKHGIRLLKQSGDAGEKLSMTKGQRIYDEAVREAVIVVWEATDRICGKRLKAAIPHMVESMERHGHLDLDPGVRDRLLFASAATLDRLLKPIRPTAGSRRRRRRGRSMGKRVPVRTYNDWNGPPPGYLEIDSGNRPGGSLRRFRVRVIHPQPGRHRHLHRLDRSGTPPGPGAVPGGGGTGGHRYTVALPHPRYRLR